MTATEGASALVNALRAKADPYKDNTLLDAADLIERLTTPPTNDEREALERILSDLPDPSGRVEAILASDVWRNRRQGPITDAQRKAIDDAVAEFLGGTFTDAVTDALVDHIVCALEVARGAS